MQIEAALVVHVKTVVEQVSPVRTVQVVAAVVGYKMTAWTDTVCIWNQGYLLLSWNTNLSVNPVHEKTFSVFAEQSLTSEKLDSKNIYEILFGNGTKVMNKTQ